MHSYRKKQIETDIRDLKKLGYAQELFREMGGFSNFAVSFSIISILTGTSWIKIACSKINSPFIG